jgi:hypothetical protein
MNEHVENPFAVATTNRTAGNAIAVAQQGREIAEVQAAMLLAKKFPRDQAAAMDRILNACCRTSLAEAAVYTYSRGNEEVTGASIRLAEAIAQQWGNIKTSVRELDQSDGASTVQAIAWDLESGYQSDKIFQVPHIRYTKKGSYKLSDPRDIYELVANMGARRLRACILAVIPGDVTEAAVSQCEKTIKARIEITPELIAETVQRFEQYGITKTQIEKRIQRNIEAIQPAQLLALKKIFNALRDGMGKPADWFDMPQEEQSEAAPAKTVADIKKAANKNTKEKKPDPTMGPGVEFSDVKAAIEKAADVETLDVAADLIGGVASAEERAALGDLYVSRKNELTKE